MVHSKAGKPDRDTNGTLINKIKSHHAVVGIVGLGYVGLPLACLAAGKGFKAIGFDLDHERIKKINQGRSYIQDVPSKELSGLVQIKRFLATPDWGKIKNCDILILCVPTPFNKNREPDLTPVVCATQEIAKRLRRGQLVILESTTYPGTTEELMLPILTTGGLKGGRDFHLAYSPERVDPGNRNFKVQDIPKVVGGLTPACREAALTFYSAIVPRVIAVSSPRVAELSKLLENIFRNVNIALVNELAMLCDRMKVDVWEVIAAASTKPFGFMSFRPGPGVGGHCIPVDPVYLSWKAKECDFYTNFIDLAAEVNSNMPYFVVRKLQRILRLRGQNALARKILILGTTFKKNVDDLRNSSAYKLFDVLREEGFEIAYHDPYFPEMPTNFGTLRSVKLTEKTLSGADCVLIHTDHDSYDWDWVARHARLIFDTRNATGSIKSGRQKIFRL
ncbi:MAG: nucleotide sugar dehydrogenase [Elusimicrobia bacterium]|nr:nucleotide sugar dehydrogenase [Elusimicrobiota bacterium]